MKLVPHFINRAENPGSGARRGEVFDPALGTQVAEVVFADQSDIYVAVEVAHAAFATWKETSLAKRSSIMFAFRQLLDERKQELAEIITTDHGKVVSDALGEINRGLEVVDFACGLPHLLKGEYSENASTSIDVYSVKQPLGVVGIFSPFNFPAMVPMWFFQWQLLPVTQSY
ncbi:MAG: hypothetical protein RI917_101 [Actinomycetota bacterium]|jgi:malonate-semialdehyde dehydrogenase (acetylating)/methylmalonate-semialdehyde dehydrogenase